MSFCTFSFCPLRCLFFFDLLILITSLWYLQTLLTLLLLRGKKNKIMMEMLGEGSFWQSVKHLIIKLPPTINYHAISLYFKDAYKTLIRTGLESAALIRYASLTSDRTQLEVMFRNSRSAYINAAGNILTAPFTLFIRGRHGRDRMVVDFTTVFVISAYQHYSCEFKLRSWKSVLDTTLCDKVCQWLVTGLWFSPASSTNKTI